MLQVDNLGIRYTDWVLRNLSFTLPEGKVLAILGPNGRGKSSLLRAMAGLQTPDAGRVQAESQVAYVPQSLQPGFDMSALDLVLTGRARHVGWMGNPNRHDRQVALACLQRLDVAHLAQRGVLHLSGGELQLVLMARALASECKLMLLDEPTSALDFHNQAVVLRVIRDLVQRDGLTVVFTTHMPQHALDAADQTLMLFDALRHAMGPTLPTLTAEALSDLYRLPIVRTQVQGKTGTHHTAVPLFRELAGADFSNHGRPAAAVSTP